MSTVQIFQNEILFPISLCFFVFYFRFVDCVCIFFGNGIFRNISIYFLDNESIRPILAKRHIYFIQIVHCWIRLTNHVLLCVYIASTTYRTSKCLSRLSVLVSALLNEGVGIVFGKLEHCQLFFSFFSKQK